MCRVSVECCCGSRRGGGGIAGVAVLGLVALVAAPTLLAVLGIVATLIQAVIWGMIISVGIVVGGWIVKEIASELIFDWSLTRHNRRMQAQMGIGYAHRTVHVITDIQQAELSRPTHRAIEPVRGAVPLVINPRKEIQ